MPVAQTKRVETVAEEAGLAHAASSGEGDRARDFGEVRIETEHYLALFEPDLQAGGCVVTFPDFGYGVTQGETDGEAMAMARDLLTLTIEDFIRASRPLPPPKRHRGAKFRPVLLSALQSAKVDLYNGFLKSGLDESGVRPPHRDTSDTH